MHVVLACAVSAAAALAGAASPSAPPGVVPVLTSTPFGAAAGQPVSHAITLSGPASGTVAVRVTFRTTIALDGLAGSTAQGRCQVTDPRTVVCDLRLPATDLPAAKMVVTGTVPPGTPAGALVQNWVGSHVEQGATGPADGVTSNAYLTPGGAGASPATTATRPAPHRAASASGSVLVAAAVLVALGTPFVVRRSRRRRHLNTPGNASAACGDTEA